MPCAHDPRKPAEEPKRLVEVIRRRFVCSGSASLNWRRAAGLLLIGVCLCASTGCEAIVVFFGTGTLVQGAECVLFEADVGGLYVLDNLGDFEVGDRVYVMGGLDPNCVSICMEGDGCIRDNIIQVPQ